MSSLALAIRFTRKRPVELTFGKVWDAYDPVAAMLLTNCAFCAAPLPTLAKQCGRCKTRYCGHACQGQHWKEGGHKDLCKRIKRGGGAERYHAEKKYKEAVAEAVKKCAKETKGQTCYICRDKRPDEGLVRGCACHTTEGFAHVSCLARQAEITCEADDESWKDWYVCRLCGQQHHGKVACALGWACWTTYVDRPENDSLRIRAMNQLGNGLMYASRFEEASLIFETFAVVHRRFFPHDKTRMISVNGNLAACYSQLGKCEHALRVKRRCYYRSLEEYDDHGPIVLAEVHGLAIILTKLKRWAEAKKLLCKHRREQWGDCIEALTVEYYYAHTLIYDSAAKFEDLSEAKRILESVLPVAERLCGPTHPKTEEVVRYLRRAREKYDGAVERALARHIVNFRPCVTVLSKKEG